MSNERPSPDELLRQVEEEERKQSRGKLKIFLGYSAGVGKTYSMLEDAHYRIKQGMDVVVASVEPHGRKETERLLEGLECMPLKTIEYRGIVLKELDLDAVLARNPQIVLVDELAHTNVPGSRNAKRYQDVQELIGAGIDVYATLNIQHLDSMNDRVTQITKIRVRETIPDSVLDEADEIEIVDLPPEELMQRFREGKVYIPSQAAMAIENFFNEGNLIALREMTLRRAAERVDEQMLEYMRSRSIPGPWPAGETLLVCIGNSSALNEKLIRNGRRLADELNAEWYALYVETPAHDRLFPEDRMQAVRALEIAAKMGAKTSSVFGVSIAEEVVRFARKNNVTRIIVGKPVRPRWRELIFGSVVNQIVFLGSSMDILIISDVGKEELGKKRERKTVEWLAGSQYLYGSGLVLAITILAYLIRPYLSPTNLVMLYLIGVVMSAIAWGLRSAIFTAAISVLVFDFLFIPPYMSLRVSDTEYAITFAAFLMVGVAISLLVVRSRDYASAAQRRGDYISALYELSFDLASVNDIKVALEVVGGHIQTTCNCNSVFLLPRGDFLTTIYTSDKLELDEKEIIAASWTYHNGTTMGRGTDTLSSAALKYYPLRTPNGIVGVMGIRSKEREGVINPEQERLIEAFASQTALAIERIELWEQIHKPISHP